MGLSHSTSTWFSRTSMQRWLILVTLLSGLVHVAGCGGVGTVCDTPGSTAECGSGRICTLTTSPDLELDTTQVNVCLRECNTALDCGDAETCREVICTDPELDIRSCQTGPLVFADDFNPCAPTEPVSD